MNNTNVMEFVKKYTMILALVAVIVFFSISTGGKLLLPQNIANLIAQNAYVFVLATGMLLTILTGGNIDLSVGSVVCFVGAIGAVAMQSWGMGAIPTAVIVLIIGLLIGAFQAYWIAFVRVPPFIVTLAGMLMFRGLSNVVLEGKTVSLSDKFFVRVFGGGADCYIPDIKIDINMFGVQYINLFCLLLGVAGAAVYAFIVFNGRASKKKKGYAIPKFRSDLIKVIVIGFVVIALAFMLSRHKGIPTVLIWVLLVVFAYGYLTSKTTTGRYFYAVGGNEKATKLSGINTNRIYFIAYANMGFLAGVAGLLTIARMVSAQPTAGQNYEMDAIGSCFIGGASAYGGTGTVPGVIIGATLMGIINQGMSIMGVDANWQKVVKGAVLLVAVIFDVVSKRQND